MGPMRNQRIVFLTTTNQRLVFLTTTAHAWLHDVAHICRTTANSKGPEMAHARKTECAEKWPSNWPMQERLRALGSAQTSLVGVGVR